jgi:hypothetical protein
MAIRTSERLRAVTTAAQLHDILFLLSSDPKNRWTRTQLLFYLPESLHSLAEEYFRGERLAVPERRPLQVDAVDPIALDEALAATTDLGAGEPEQTATRFQPSTVSELLAEPPSGDEDVVGFVLQALLQEIKTVDRESPKRYRLTDGRCVGPQGHAFVYVFRWSSEPDLFVPGELQIGKKRSSARVGRQSEGERHFELHLDEFLGATIPQAVFWIDPTYLLRSAFQHLSGYRDVFIPGEGVAGKLFERPERIALPPANPALGHHLNPGQLRALATARAAELGYVWGPPGTGKTTSLGYLIRDLVAADQRVLVLSPYNIAVDEAVLSAHKRGDWKVGEIVRLGRISDDVRDAGLDLESLLEVRAERSGLLLTARSLHAAVMSTFQIDDRPAPATVRRTLEDLGEVVVQLGRQSGSRAESTRIVEGIQKIRRAFRKPEAEILAGASVVGTTISLSLVSQLVYERPYDHVIVDEASVVRTPEALLVALMSGARVTFFGDPKQLPSIVRCRTPETGRWLKPSPFALAKIDRPSDARGACAMLTQQHRMAPPIREMVSQLFYDGALEDGNCPSHGRVLLLDTSSTGAEVVARWIRLSQSKENLIHRAVTASFLRALRRREQKPLDGKRPVEISPSYPNSMSGTSSARRTSSAGRWTRPSSRTTSSACSS